MLDVKTTRFACTTGSDCAADFSCVGGECVAACSESAPCPAGLDCNERRCVDRDECRSGAACGDNSECVNTVGSFECRCVTGFSGTTTTGAPAVVGVITTEDATTLALDAGAFDVGLAVNQGVSGIIGSRFSSAWSGTVTYAATASSAHRFSGVVASFYAVQQRDPSMLSLTHTANARGFTVSWSGGRSNGGNNGCAIQVQLFDGSWSSVTSGNCDADTSARAVTLPLAANWYGSA